MLAVMGLVPKTLQALSRRSQHRKQHGIPTEEFVDTIQWMEEELQDELEDRESRNLSCQPDKNVFTP